MDFNKKLEQIEEGEAHNPFAAKNSDGDWLQGTISIDFLNEHFGHLETVNEMKNATESEGLKLYFQYLKDEGILD